MKGIKVYKRVSRRIEKRRFKKYRFISGSVIMLGASSKKTLLRDDIKPTVELVVND